MNVYEKIEAQQKGRENTPVWMVGEQLKDICREDASFEQIVAEDLENDGMSIDKAEKQIKAYADKNRKGNCACVPPNVADKIIREFYGIPEKGKRQLVLIKPEPAPAAEIDFSDYF